MTRGSVRGWFTGRGESPARDSGRGWNERLLYSAGMLKSTIFREYDIRGIAETELLDAGIHDLGRAVGTYLQRHNGKNINLGRDCRLSSDRLRGALIGGPQPG